MKFFKSATENVMSTQETNRCCQMVWGCGGWQRSYFLVYVNEWVTCEHELATSELFAYCMCID